MIYRKNKREIKLNTIICGNCLEIMPLIPDKSIDMILCDLPYETTKNKWDVIIPFDLLWKQYNRILKNNANVVLFGQGIFAYNLALSNKSWFKYDLVWKKGERCSGHLDCKKRQLRNHELILVFYDKQPTYNPQMILGKKAHSRGKGSSKINNNYGKFIANTGEAPNGDLKYPKSILDFDRPHPPIHPTQKPVTLFEYLIKTYTNEGDTVLDNCIGSGTTAIACINTKRNYIGIEKEEKYCKIAEERILKERIKNEPSGE